MQVVGISTFASDLDINASVDIDGHTELDFKNVSGIATQNGLVVTSGFSTFTGTNGDLDELEDDANVSGVSDWCCRL